jgi:enamine deaminase RidA (YjgF/YER057c/UK114 family)
LYHPKNKDKKSTAQHIQTRTGVQGQDARKRFEGARSFLKRLSNPPVITGVIVAGLANPDYLVEIEAIAFKNDE